MAALEPLEGVLIARAGEEILCPTCTASLFMFTADATVERGRSILDLGSVSDHGVISREPDGNYLNCRGDGDFPDRCAGPSVDRALASAFGPRLFIRSGSWVGWRELGE